MSHRIFFYSLECDYASLATAANVFGIPYKPAMMRRVIPRAIWEENEENGRGGGNGRIVAGGSEVQSADSTWSDKFHFQSRRSNLPTVALSGCGGKIQICSGSGGAHSNETANSTSTNSMSNSAGYTINATWRFRTKEEDKDQNNAEAGLSETWLRRANFFVERYRVFTKKAGVCFRGNVKHPPWPLHRVEVEKLEISDGGGSSSNSSGNTDGSKNPSVYPYYSGAENSKNGNRVAIDRLIADISSRRPDHVCFSPGVGPVEFDWLRPKMFW
jgi:hypothetical protein